MTCETDRIEMRGMVEVMVDISENRHEAAPSRRRLIMLMAASFGLGAASAVAAIRIRGSIVDPFRYVREAVAAVTPAAGVKTAVSFGDSIERLVAAGAIDPEKFRSLDTVQENSLEWVERLFAAPSAEPILLSAATAPSLLNLLWPLGLATKATFNERSPLNGVRLPSFASTAGWSLGRESNGYVYFNKVETLRLTEEQEKSVLDVATNTFRPCCDNSTYFQDCNHGSALLGLIELAASQNATTDELYRIALAANSYWFPNYYNKTALYLALFENQSWTDTPPQTILGARFSSLSGWLRNVNIPLRSANFLPGVSGMGQGTCAV